MKRTIGCLCVFVFLVGACTKQTDRQIPEKSDKVGVLTKISIGGVERYDNIRSEMEFGVTHEKKLKVDVETSSADSVVTYTPELESGFWKLELQKENELTISVKAQNQITPTVYKVKITHEVKAGFGKKSDLNILNFINVEGFKIDGVDQESTLDMADGILEGRDTVVQLLGPVATIRVGYSPLSGSSALVKPDLKSVKLNSQEMIKTDPKPPYADYEYILTVPLILGDITDVNIEAETNDGAKTEVCFKIHRLKGTVDVPGIWMFLDDDEIIENSSPMSPFTEGDANGKFPQLNGDDPTKIKIGVVDLDLLEAVEIDGKKETVVKGTFGSKTFYHVEKLVTGIAPNNKDVKITLIPKDKLSYDSITLNFNLNYYPATKNADFAVEKGSSDPIFDVDIQWTNDQKDKGIDLYGAKTVTMSFYTKSPTTKVFYKEMLLLWNKGADNEQVIVEEKDLTQPEELVYTHDTSTEEKNRRYKHTTKKITLHKNRPTTLRFFTRAQDGTESQDKGSIDFEYNPIKLRWDYVNREKGKEFQKLALDEIKIDKASVSADKKIYVVFRLYNEEQGFKIDNAKINKPHQGNFEVMPKDEPVIAWMKTEIDVSDLLKETDPVEELEISLPVMEQTKKDKDGKPIGEFVECFTYKVKVKLNR